MHKNILARLALDKSVTFAGVKPLHSSLFLTHFWYSSTLT
jgi:hypothetical protein